jgi:hypothetical protein
MGWLLIVSIAAMTSFMTMVQLIALTLTTTQSPPAQASVGSQRTDSASAKSQTKKNGKVVSRRSAKHHTRRNAPHTAPRLQHIAPAVKQASWLTEVNRCGSLRLLSLVAGFQRRAAAREIRCSSLREVAPG